MDKQNNILNLALFENLDIFTKNKQYKDIAVENEVFYFYKSNNSSYFNLLNDIIKATKIDMDKIKTVEISETENVNMGKFYDDSKCEVLIFFGFTNDELGIPSICKKYQTINLRNKTLLLAETLEVISNDKASKNLLWKSLKEIFNIL